MRLITLFLPAAVLVAGLTPASGDEPKKNEPKYAPMPWHLVDAW